jgi:hypothetical protein
VALPKRLWQMGQPRKEVERMYLLANSVETALHDARFKLEDVEMEASEVRGREGGRKEGGEGGRGT